MKFIILGHILCILSLVSGHCPPPEGLVPCECIIDIRDHLSLICDGNQIKDLKNILNDNLKVDSQNNLLIFKTLLINDTSITAIEPETFGDAIFEKILIKNNPNLTNINPKAFQNTVKTNTSLDLYLINNINYDNSEQLFNLINTLKPKQEIFLENLGINEIPDFAFSYNPFIEIVVIIKSKVKRIGKSAFIQLPKLSTLVLAENQISVIDSNGLTFDLNSDGSNLWLLLDNNKLTEDSFQLNWSNSESGNRNIEFNLDYNLIKTLPENVFKPVLLSTSTEFIYLANNELICDCNIKYLSIISEQIEHKLKSANCSNFDSKDVLSLKAEEFGKC